MIYASRELFSTLVAKKLNNLNDRFQQATIFFKSTSMSVIMLW